ncbi:hypothetical protein EH31_02700 [Erythrobacter longus]|uniref:HTH luxR-type domain-containing protein n=1 Tax=Erythrobacter longus TaxID=1044 RepID=A0A074N125_ERYLO|nr:DUF4019 domain-containing protein [Erythrobacter longus]KEO91597.1 hypothetical protein EH31_02700 [Erythrobacter longus]
MAQEIGDLTEKEKEALRLLVEGHDAKSSANLLGLSVHTVNDRLRNARRKLGVSSSREAARILRDAEGETPQTIPQNPPQISAHTSFGMAAAEGAADNAILDQRSQKAPNRYVWLAGGMLIMSVLIAIAIFAAVSNTGGEERAASSSGGSSPQAASSTESSGASAAALSRARQFIRAVDAGNWTGSWEVAGTFFQSQAGADEWTALVEPVRGPLGKVEERRLATVQKAASLPGAPEGDYEILQYQTKFSKVDEISTETVILIRNGDGFDIAGYYIR